MILTLAIAATQVFAPKDSARRQLALLPPATSVAGAAPLISLATLEPRALPAQGRSAGDIPAPLPARPALAGEGASLVAPVAAIPPLAPSDAVVARPAMVGRADRCVAAAPASRSTPVGLEAPATPEAFGLMLANAALAETEDLVVYTDKYRDIGFPMGDVPALYGVCTDVIVRAYRALGIDLQALVHKARLGTGDPSIDHRRTETLRRFFAKHGVSIPVTDYPEDYKPGDIVTYHRPEGRGSQSHIALVSDVIAPSGRPMVVHNRGWGPQLEDALFANSLTGHYRFSDTVPADQASLPAKSPSASSPVQSPWPAAEALRVSAADGR